MFEDKLFRIINLLFFSGGIISSNGVFTFENVDTVKKLKEEITKEGIDIDNTYADTEINLIQKTIDIYSNYDSFKSKLPQILKGNNYKKYHCLFDSEKKALVVLIIEKDKANSFFYRESISNQTDFEFSLSNVFYWNLIIQKIQNIADISENDECATLIIPNELPQNIYFSDYQKSFNSQNLLIEYQILNECIKGLGNQINILKRRIIELVKKIESDSGVNSEIVSSLQYICESAEADFEIANYKIDFEVYLKSFSNQISCFFDKSREIIDKMITSAISLPVALAGVFFTVDSFSDKNDVIQVLSFSLITFSIFSCLLLVYYFFDIKKLRNDTDSVIKNYTKGSVFLKKQISNDIKILNNRFCFVSVILVLLIMCFIILTIFAVVKLEKYKL